MRRDASTTGTRRAWITGAGKGLGRAVAIALCRRGVDVAASARTVSDLESLAREGASFSDAGALVPFPSDVTDPEAMANVVDAIESRLGPLDLVILNAGTHTPLSAHTFAVEPFRRLVETNLMGVVHGLSAVMPRFMARRSGHLVVIASVAGYRGLHTAAAYGATKAALINMCEALKPELDRSGVKLTLVNPGFVRTPLTDQNPFKMPFLLEPEDAAERLIRGIESRRFEVTFPRRLTWGLKLMRCLPYGIYFSLAGTLAKDGR